MSHSISQNDERRRQQLTRALTEVAESLHVRDGLVIENAADYLDQVRLLAERDLASQTLTRQFEQLQQITSAIERLDSGEYGVCESCEEKIPARRLDALPWAVRCVRCQELFDQSHGAWLDGEKPSARVLDHAA